MGVSVAGKPDLSRRSLRKEEVLGEQGAKSEPSAPSTVTLIDGRRIGFATGASVEERIGGIAELQRGRASRGQLLVAGIHRSSIRRRLQNGRLKRLHVGVYGLPY